MNSALLGSVALMLTFGAVLLTPMPRATWQKEQPKDSTPGMDMSGDEDMSKMTEHGCHGWSHVYDHPTANAARRHGEGKGGCATLKASMERYKDYRKALADGYYTAMP
jgi:hypothetical protein